MGASLSSRIEWVSASDTGGKLAFSKSNEGVLMEVLKFVEGLVRDHPREATVVFQRPFCWKSSLDFSVFESLAAGEEYTASGTGLVSAAKMNNGDPFLSISKVQGGLEVKAFRFKDLQKILSLSGEQKLKQVQLCLEANPDPVAVIMGPAFSSSVGKSSGNSNNTLLEIHEQLAREKVHGNESEELDSSFRLLLLLNSLDLKLLHSSVKEMGKEIRLSPKGVEIEVELLKKFSGPKENSCLEKIEYTSQMVFSNGCRAPPWRQVLGDICYITVKPLDGEEACVTASTEGFFINKGMKANGEVDYDRAGDHYSTLVALLKAKSKQFAENIVKQEFSYASVEQESSGAQQQQVEQQVRQQRMQDRMLEGVDAAAEVANQTKQSKEKALASPESKAVQRKSVGSERKRFTGSTFETAKMIAQPSDKWKSLSASDDLFTTAPQSPPKTVKTRVSTRVITPPSAGSRPTKSGSSVKSRHNRDSFDDLDDSGSSSEASEEEDQQDRRPESNADLPSEYWQIQKLIKYLKAGNQTATVVALCSLMDVDLKLDASQLAIRDSGGLDLLINLLETNDVKCKIGALRILREISQKTQTRRAIVDLGGLPMVVQILSSDNRELKCLAAETIANVAKFRRARRIVRLNGGIKKLVYLTGNPGRPGSPVSGERSDLDIAKSAAMGLWSCSRSKHNKFALLKAGAVPLLAKLLQCEQEDVMIPVVGTLQECASERVYQELIQSEGMVQHLVRGLKTENKELQKHCASTIFKCAESDSTRTLVREFGGLEPLAALLTKTDNKDLLSAATGAVWKCSKSPKNVAVFKTLRVIENLVSLLSNQPEEVLVNVVGALGECAAQDPDNRVSIRKAGGVIPLVQLLTGTNQALLINTTKAIGACALDTESMTVIDKQDGVRLLWSLLKSPNTEVQSSASWAICPCIENAKDAGELVRSFVGGLELIVGLLKSSDEEVLASVCAAIAKIAKDEENLGVFTDHGVVPLLAKLTHITSDSLRKHLTDAIARCCMWRNNRVAFGQAMAVAPLVSYLQSTDPQVHRSTACALHQLSKDPDNCITMHEAGVVQPLLKMVGSTDPVLQEAAAGCISNIRQLALANEKAKFK